MVLLSLSANGHKAETPYSDGREDRQGGEVRAGAGGDRQGVRLEDRLPREDPPAILNFIPEVQQAFHGPEALPLTSVPAFAKVPREEQAAALAKVRGGGAKKVREVTAAVEAAQTGRSTSPPRSRRRSGAAEGGEAGGGGGRHADPGEEEANELVEIGTACALLGFLLGDGDALKGHPRLQAAVAQVAATL
jgi:hypothetical protein